MQRKGILRFCLIICLCLFILLYNGVGIIKKLPKIELNEEKEETPLFNGGYIFDYEEETENLVQSTPETAEDQKEEEIKESVQTAAGAVKGKIISSYVSPYEATYSYSGVNLKNNTNANINLKSLLEANLGFKIESGEKPQVLIMHTHTTESYMLTDSDVYNESFTSRSTDNSKNMVKIGEIIAEKLNTAGIKTLHAKNQHDYPQYNGSYGRSAKTVSEYLKKYPSIKVVLDIHRDAISQNGSDKVKLVTKIGDKKAAQVMLVMGSETGSVKNHSKWKENLKLAVKLQNLLEKDYPTLARPISLVSSKYNQHLTTGSLLIEVGSDANSLEEACYSAELLGNTISKLLK